MQSAVASVTATAFMVRARLESEVVKGSARKKPLLGDKDEHAIRSYFDPLTLAMKRASDADSRLDLFAVYPGATPDEGVTSTSHLVAVNLATLFTPTKTTKNTPEMQVDKNLSFDQFSHDLTLALEETSRGAGGRWGMRRRTRSTGNLRESAESTSGINDS